MLSIPSVGSVVSGVLLNKDATKAKITFNDGCSVIIGVNNKGVLAPTLVTSKKKKKLKESLISVNKPFKKPKNKIEEYASNLKQPSQTSYKSALSHAKSRVSRLAESTMTAAEKMALAQEDGQEIDLSKLT